MWCRECTFRIGLLGNVCSLTSLSTQIGASKFQNLSKIPLKKLGVWKIIVFDSYTSIFPITTFFPAKHEMKSSEISIWHIPKSNREILWAKPKRMHFFSGECPLQGQTMTVLRFDSQYNRGPIKKSFLRSFSHTDDDTGTYNVILTEA